MLVIFKSKNHGDITMFGDIAKQLILAMDCSGNIPAGLHADDVESALEALNLKLTQLTEQHNQENNEDEDQPKAEHWQPSLKQRALPLIEMLEGAQKFGDGISWDNG